MRIKNTKLANEKLLVGNELVEFDSEGFAEIKDELGHGLLSLPFFGLVGKTKEKPTEVETPIEVEVEEVLEVEILGTGELEAVEKVNLEALTLVELKKIATEKGIEYPKNITKAKILELLK